MQRFYRVVYRIDKNDDPGTAVERIERAVAQSGSTDHRMLFLFMDAVFSKQKSALDYLVECFPLFENYRTAMKFLPTARTPVIIGDGVPCDTLLEVARGIPRRFAFGTATFSWRDVEALDFSPESPAADSSAGGLYASIAGRIGIPSITLVSKWGAPKRSLDLMAVVRLNAEFAGGKKPQLPERTQTLLDAIGRRKSDDVFVMPDASEAAETKEALAQIDDAFKRARSLLIQRISELALEPLDARAPRTDAVESPGSVKEPLAQTLAPLGYAPVRGAGSPGVMLFEKRTPEGHQLRIAVDRGTWSNHFLGRFEIRSEQWMRAMSIPLAPGDFPGRPYPLLDERQIRRLCNNLATVVTEIEKIVYPPVRDALGSSS